MNVPKQSLRIYLLGPFRVVRDGETLSDKCWPQRKTKTLLKLLVSQRGKPFTQDQLVDSLFPNLALDKAIKSLYNRISELRRVLEPDLKRGSRSAYILRVGPGSYCFSDSANCWVDTEAFGREVATARKFQQVNRWPQAARHLQRALDLYQGAYLADDPYEEWTLDARERWGERHANALLEHAECQAKLGNPARAIDECRCVLRQQPTNEQAYRQMMTYAAHMGDGQRLVLAYRDCEEALWTRLKVKPAAETTARFEALQRQIGQRPALRQRPQRDPTPPPHAPRPPARRRMSWAVMTVLLLLSAAGWWGFSQLTFEAKAPSIAVLPFVNVGVHLPEGGGFPIEDFADGTTMELANALSQIPGLKVASTTSTFGFKGKNESVSQIGRQLNVSTVLEGNLLRAGNRMRITLQLIDVESGLHLWSGRYEADILDDSFAMLDELIPQIAEAIADQLKPLLQHPSHAPLNERLVEQFKQFFRRYIDVP